MRHLSVCVCLPQDKASCLRYGKIVSEVQNSLYVSSALNDMPDHKYE